ncbi:MAG: MarC family protein [Paludibacteraceae bacterium]|nr:MarC family protein [Paludibacteraceae bacterium]MBR6043298.1 MarC family protein [Paludibacteraceae bacterium]MCR5568020.1 MarC family protein [Paludibacteraceae bacterium]
MDWLSVFSVFMVLFAVIDTMGALPVLVDLQKSGKKINAVKTVAIASTILYVFMFAGEFILNLFNVDFSSFAVAGSIVLLFLSLEMILETDFFKGRSSDDATVIPIAFPLIAGPGCITTLISLQAEFPKSVIATALFLNLVVVFIVLKFSVKIEQLMGETINYILKKFFGIILLAMAVRMFASNISALLHMN